MENRVRTGLRSEVLPGSISTTVVGMLQIQTKGIVQAHKEDTTFDGQWPLARCRDVSAVLRD